MESSLNQADFARSMEDTAYRQGAQAHGERPAKVPRQGSSSGPAQQAQQAHLEHLEQRPDQVQTGWQHQKQTDQSDQRHAWLLQQQDSGPTEEEDEQMLVQMHAKAAAEVRLSVWQMRQSARVGSPHRPRRPALPCICRRLA